MKAKLLSSEEILDINKRLPQWEIKEKKISREFKFLNFVEAFGFMTKVAIMAESINHHPNWSNVYSNVKIDLTSHDLDGISTLDIELALAIDNLSIK